MSVNKLEFSSHLDGTGFARGMKDISISLVEGLRGFALQAAGIYGVEQAISKTVETADELVNTAKRMGATVEQVQILKQAAKDSGTEVEKLAGAFEKINIARAKALGGGPGSKNALAGFAQLGIGRGDLQSQSAATLFTNQIANAVKTKSVEELASAFHDLGMRGFGELIPVLKTNFEELGAKMKTMGAIISTETALKLKLFGDELSLISTIIISQLAPALVYLAEKFLWFVQKLGELGAAGGAFSVGQAHRTAGEDQELAGLKSWLANKGSFQDLMKHWQGLTPANRALLFQEKGADIQNFVQRRVGYLEAKGNVAGDIVVGQMNADDKQRAALAQSIKDQANALNHPVIPNFDEEVDADKVAKKSKAARKPASDSLIEVGNFLGAGGGGINNVAEQHLQVARETLGIQKNILDRMDKLVDKASTPASGDNFGDFLVPP